MIGVKTPADDVLHDLLHGRIEDVLADLDDEEEQDAHCHNETAESLGGRNIGWQVIVLQQRCPLVDLILTDTVVVSISVGLDIRAHAGRLGVCLCAVSCHDRAGSVFLYWCFFILDGPW